MTLAQIVIEAPTPTRDEILARISLLAGEMDGNDEENLAMHEQVADLRRRADAIPPPAEREELLARAQLLAQEMDANENENLGMQDEIDSLYMTLDSADAPAAEVPAG